MPDVRIIGRSMGSDFESYATPSLKSLEDGESLGVICGHPDDLHYELEPMAVLENEEE